MKRLYILVLLLWALFFGYSTTSAQPLRFDATTHDFGTINEEDGMVSHTFRFTNVSDTPVVIVDAASSCGCTQAEFSRKPVQAGGTGEIVVHFNPTDYPDGVFSRNVRIFTSQGKLAEPLTVTGKIIPRVKSVAEKYPLALSNGIRLEMNAHAFGYVEHGSPQRSAFGIVNDSEQKATINIVPTLASGWLDIHYPQSLAPHEEATIDFGYMLSDDCPKYGSLRDLLAMEIDGKRSDYELIISGIAIDSRERNDITGEPGIRLSENFIKFGTLKRTDTAPRRTITIYNTGDSPLHIRAIETEYGIIAVGKPDKSTVEKGGQATFSISLRPDRCSFGAVTDRVKIVTDDRRQPMRSIRVSALIEK